MRVLILTASYGSGHNAAAQSLAVAFEAAKGREQRSGVDLEDPAADLLDPLRDPEAVHGCQAQAPEDQHVERAAGHFGGISGALVHLGIQG